MKFALLAVLLMLSACKSPEQIVAEHKSACLSYGFKEGDKELATCMMMQNMAREQQKQSGLIGMQNALGGWQNSIQANPYAPASTRCSFSMNRPVVPGAIDVSGASSGTMNCY